AQASRDRGVSASEMLDPAFARRLTGMATAGTDGTPTQDQDRIYGVVQFPESGGRLVAAVDRGKALARVEDKIGRGALVSAGALALAVLLALSIARSVAEPLERLTDAARAARRFQDADLPVLRDYAEVESLSQSMQALLRDNRHREAALRTARAE
ncbi:hypothetical protein, partial [Rhodoplanes sp. SY1]|uniref:hypothetical protein n=1 Tax=Rhodoplanes sp. SY1 TaxID=3166646 RepID=UPI0038B4899A